MFFSIYKSRNLIYYIIFDMVTSLIQVHEVIAIGENEMVQNVLQLLTFRRLVHGSAVTNH